MYSASERKRFS